MNIEKESNSSEERLEIANEKWLKTDSHERQILLFELVAEGVIDNPGKVIKLKYSKLSDMPALYREAIVRKYENDDRQLKDPY